MPTKGAIEFATFCEVLRQEANIEPGDEVIQDAVRISRAARAVDNHAVAVCNWPEISVHVAKARDRAVKVLREAERALKIKFSVNGDPRGHVVKLKTPKSGRYNTFGGAEVGWGVPI